MKLEIGKRYKFKLPEYENYYIQKDSDYIGKRIPGKINVSLGYLHEQFQEHKEVFKDIVGNIHEDFYLHTVRKLYPESKMCGHYHYKIYFHATVFDLVHREDHGTLFVLVDPKSIEFVE